MWRQSLELGNFSIKRLWFETYPSLLSLLHLLTPPLNFRNPSSLSHASKHNCLPAHPEVCSSTAGSKLLLPKAGSRRINYGQSGKGAAVSGRKQRKLLVWCWDDGAMLALSACRCFWTQQSFTSEKISIQVSVSTPKAALALGQEQNCFARLCSEHPRGINFCNR